MLRSRRPLWRGIAAPKLLRRGVRPVRHHRGTAAVTVVFVIPVVLSTVFFLHLFLHPSLSPSFLLSFHPSLPPLCFPPLASLAVDMIVFSTCYGCYCCLSLLLSFLQLLLRLLMQLLLRPVSVQRIAFENATFCVQLTFVDWRTQCANKCPDTEAVLQWDGRFGELGRRQCSSSVMHVAFMSALLR